MKTVLNYIMVAAFLLVSTAGVANGAINTSDKKGNAKSEVEKSLIAIDLDPVFIKKGEKVLINLLNITQGEVILKVYDSENRLVYSESIEGELVVEKAFNFEKAFEDEYTVVVVDKMGTYKETIEVR